jgi:myosin heavy subunit
MHRLNPFVFSGPESLFCSAEGEGASTGTATTTAPAAAPTAKPAVEEEPRYLSDRLERERRATLKKLGIELDRDEDLSTSIEKAKKKFDGWKEERNTLRERVKSLETEAQKTASDTAAVKVYAEAEMGSLTEAQREAVKKAAGESASEQLKTIGAWRAAGMLKTDAVVPPAAPAGQSKPVLPADTVPAASAPAAVTTSEVNHKETYASLRKNNPFAAARYAAEHPEAYES